MLPVLRDLWSLPLLEERGCPREASDELPICPQLWGSSQPTCCFPQINSSWPFHKSGYSLLIISNHRTWGLERSLKSVGSATLSDTWSSDSSENTRTRPEITRQTSGWGSDTLWRYSNSKPHSGGLGYFSFCDLLDQHILRKYPPVFSSGFRRNRTVVTDQERGFLGRVNSCEQHITCKSPLSALPVTCHSYSTKDLSAIAKIDIYCHHNPTTN